MVKMRVGGEHVLNHMPCRTGYRDDTLRRENLSKPRLPALSFLARLAIFSLGGRLRMFLRMLPRVFLRIF
jgi:hypothetical protein